MFSGQMILITLFLTILGGKQQIIHQLVSLQAIRFLL